LFVTWDKEKTNVAGGINASMKSRSSMENTLASVSRNIEGQER